MVGVDDRDGGPAGPRGRIGRSGEDAAARYLAGQGWRIIGRNIRVDRDELDIVALDAARPTQLVIVEVRASSRGGFGHPLESVDARKVARLYRAASRLTRSGGVATPDHRIDGWRVDLVTLSRSGARDWTVTAHLRGLEPP